MSIRADFQDSEKQKKSDFSPFSDYFTLLLSPKMSKPPSYVE
jgi:hypothetical protein